MCTMCQIINIDFLEDDVSPGYCYSKELGSLANAIAPQESLVKVLVELLLFIYLILN